MAEKQQQFRYRNLINKDDWDLLVDVYVNFLGSAYLEGKSGFVLNKSHELINELTESLTGLAERLKRNIPGDVNIPLDVFDVNGGLSVCFDESALVECVQTFCVNNRVDYTQAVNYHKTARSAEQGRVYRLLREGLIVQRMDYSKLLIALGRCGAENSSFLNNTGDGRSECVSYSSTFLDYWSLSMVLQKLDASVTSKLLGNHQLIFDILGPMPQSSGVMLSFYVV